MSIIADHSGRKKLHFIKQEIKTELMIKVLTSEINNWLHLKRFKLLNC